MDMDIENALIVRIRPVKLLVLDVDGVMTDGSIIYTDEGVEIKAFNVRDGHGIKMLKRAGIDTAIITARSSKVVAHRAANLGIELVIQGAIDKAAAFDDLLAKTKLHPNQTAYAGDDVIDLPVMRRAGFSVAVADAVKEVRLSAHYVTTAPGGRGAVREMAELILKAQGKWEEAMRRYT